MLLSALCQRCGLCCDGNLFSHVPLQRAEVAAARQSGLDVVELAGGAPALRQGCPALKGRQCSVYAERPEGCRRYGCRLYGALERREISLEEAVAVVEQAHGLLSAVEAGLGPDPEARPPPVMERARFADLSEDGGLTPEARAARERAEAFLDHHFHGGPRRVVGA